MIILCDIDGVLANCEHRLKYLRERDYDSFYSIEMANDTTIDSGIKLLRALKSFDHNPKVFFITGRPERTRSITKLWVENCAGFTIPGKGHLIMRKDGDHRPSPAVKVEQIKSVLNPELPAPAQVLKTAINAFATLLDRDEPSEDIYFIDDDPENVKAVCKAFPTIIGITFGIRRFND